MKPWTQTEQPAVEYQTIPPPRIRAIAPADLSVVFQPIVDVKRRRLFAAEMLARCSHPELRNPAVMFEHAELQKTTGRLGRMLREVGFSVAPELPLFINLHPHELSERWLVRPDDPMNFFEHGLYLEVTESAALDYFELCRSSLRELCGRLGAKLVVDDFGAGHSNLLRIAELEPAIVKIDRALVQDVHRHGAKRKIIRHTVALCEDLGAEVVAEGIETVEELHTVMECGVHYAQGYLLARPAHPLPEFAWPAG